MRRHPPALGALPVDVRRQDPIGLLARAARTDQLLDQMHGKPLGGRALDDAVLQVGAFGPGQDLAPTVQDLAATL